MSARRKLDKNAVASGLDGATGDALHTFLLNTQTRLEALETGQNEQIATSTAKVHNIPDDNDVELADCFDLASAITLVNALKAAYEAHRADAGAHDAADATNTIAAADASDQATADTLADEIKLDLNTHRSEAGVHANDDAANAVTAADGDGTEATLVLLVNDIKAAMNGHVDESNAVGVNTTSDLREAIIV